MDTSQKLKTTPIIAIVGETASGKTAAAITLANKIDGEIICADSRTVYKYMNIGTAKPTKKEQSGIRHHLIDVIKPNQKYNVALFVEQAKKSIQDIQKRGKVAIVVGGTGLYIDALLYDFQFPDKQDKYNIDYLQQMTEVELTTLLNKESININGLNTKNKRHLINAIIRNGSKGKFSPLAKNSKILGIKLDRSEINIRIEKRVEKMFSDGFLTEVKEVTNRFGWDSEAMTGIGYKVARDYFKGDSDIESVKKAFIARDRSLAKRQRTWFKRNKDIIWFDSTKKLVDYAVEFVNSMNYN